MRVGFFSSFGRKNVVWYFLKLVFFELKLLFFQSFWQLLRQYSRGAQLKWIFRPKICLKPMRATPCQMNCSFSKNELLYYTKQQTSVYISKNIHKKLVRGKKRCVGHVIGPKLKNFAFTVK